MGLNTCLQLFFVKNLSVELQCYVVATTGSFEAICDEIYGLNMTDRDIITYSLRALTNLKHSK